MTRYEKNGMYNARKWLKDVNHIENARGTLWLIAWGKPCPNRIILKNHMVVWDNYWRRIDLRGEARIIWQTLFRDVFLVTE